MNWRHLFIHILLSTPLSLSCWAQDGDFTADDTVGCVPFTVTFDDDYPTTTRVYDYGDGSPEDALGEHEYTSTGYFTVKLIRGSTNENPNPEEIVKEDYIRVVGTPEPQFQLRECVGNVVQVNITGDNYDEYVIDYGDGSPGETYGPESSGTYTYPDATQRNITVTGKYTNAACTGTATESFTPVTGLDQPELLQVSKTDSNYRLLMAGRSPLLYEVSGRASGGNFNPEMTFRYVGSDTLLLIDRTDVLCFRARNKDFCGNNATSNILCTMELNGEAENNQNVLSWNQYMNIDDLIRYDLYKDDQLVYSGTDTSYTDGNITCGQSYDYFVEAIVSLNANNNARSVSQIVEVTGISTDTPPPLENTYISYWDNFILHWDYVPAENYILFQGDERISFTSEDTLLQLSSEAKCFRPGYIDDCDNRSDSASDPLICPSRLERTQSDDAPLLLTWNAYIHSNLTITGYEVIATNRDDGTILETWNVGGDTSLALNTLPDAQNITFTVAVSNGRGFNIKSNPVQYSQTARVYFPTAFSPNGDGKNDAFKPVGSFIEEYELHIFNRWGELLYHSTSLEDGWNGKYRNKDVSEGHYIYRCEFSDLNGIKQVKKGTIVLIR